MEARQRLKPFEVTRPGHPGCQFILPDMSPTSARKGLGTPDVEAPAPNPCPPGLYTSSRQYGFRRGRSAEDAIYDTRRIIDQYHDRYVIGILLDATAAFDNLWWPSIFEELSLSSLPERLGRTVGSIPWRAAPSPWHATFNPSDIKLAKVPHKDLTFGISSWTPSYENWTTRT